LSFAIIIENDVTVRMVRMILDFLGPNFASSLHCTL